MNLKNFQLYGDGISIEWEGQNLDLHNNFCFESLHYALQLKQVEAVWIRSTEHWASDVTLPGLMLVFKDVSFFRVKERDEAYPFSEDGCLAIVSFHSALDRDEFDSISLEAGSDDDLTFFFQSEWGFKVNAKSVELISLSDSDS